MPITRTLILSLAASALSPALAPAQVFSSSPNVPILDTPTVENTIHISSGPSAITSLRVIIKVRHTYDSDLDIVLVHGNDYLRLSRENGQDGQDYYVTRFRDDTTDFIYEGFAPFNGDFRPEGGQLTPAADATIALPANAMPDLASFNGENANGDWSLWIDDVAASDTGTLLYWSLEVNGAEDPNGPYGGGPPPPPPPTCDESGEADELPATAHVCQGSGPLARLVGVLSDGDVDMYAINICDVAAFSATTVGGSYVDTQLFLFDAQGLGVTCNDEDPSGLYSQSTITDVHVHSTGRYYLAVSEYNRDPVDSQGHLIWNDSPFDTERAPDGPGAANPVSAWVGSGPGGDYHVLLTGVCFDGPQCGSADFNCDGDVGTDQDIEAYFACLAGNCPAPPCAGSADFNGDGDVGTDADIEAFFRVLAGGNC